MSDKEKVIRITRALADQGKLIEAGWMGLRLLAVAPDAPAIQIEEMRNAFFAGAQHVFSSLISMTDDNTEEPTETEMRRMELIDTELKAFIAEFKRQHPETSKH